MLVNKEALRQLMAQDAPGKDGKGNYNEFSRIIDVNVGHLHRFLNNDNSVAGPVFLGKLMVYCMKRGLNFNDYIFLPDPFSTDKG